MTRIVFAERLAWLNAAQATDDRLSLAELGEREQAGDLADDQGEQRQDDKANSRAR